ncbi:cellulose synthase complex periplasmic endoglucanase BcsZ [Acidovorax sp. Root402]|uniref:cellulose synthase complex periplasmic endoglucanase BcsZ n=1 Tax=Acidovorax sp. Root402 TaxID=1736527 RepID=UPI0006F94BB0|nr:cellulose synthase complex periplasmic endoglucanase BcsZ [Acidovorax sp. Root402]KQW25913.1 1,4-D-glucanase [Acidovorax sp. Root402]
MTESLRRRTALQAGGGAVLLSWLPGLRAQPQSTAERPGWPAWEAFKAQFINEGGRVISDDAGGGQTYSEGQAYALFFALVANDRTTFDKLLRWTENNLCDGDMTARLPAWLWGKRPDGTWGVIDSNAASDADLWMAYALGEAGRLWNVRTYRALSALLAARILREETAQLPGLGLTLLPAPQGFAQKDGRWRLNPSYMPMHLMHWLAAVDPQPEWKQLVDSSLKVIQGASPKGLTPDWTVYDPKQGFLVDDKGKEKGQGSYNAIRVYLWAGTLHANAPGRKALLDTLQPMARFVREQGYPPESIDILTAQASGPAPSGFSAAVLPFLRAVGDDRTLQSQRMRLEARPLRPTAYYEQVLGLFGLGAMEGQYRFTANGQLTVRWKP